MPLQGEPASRPRSVGVPGGRNVDVRENPWSLVESCVLAIMLQGYEDREYLTPILERLHQSGASADDMVALREYITASLAPLRRSRG